MTTPTCESCSMPIETGRYCEHCTDAEGNLQGFEERFATMTAWRREREPGLDQASAEAETLAWMASMPAWAAHPQVVSRQASIPAPTNSPAAPSASTSGSQAARSVEPPTSTVPSVPPTMRAV